jgi:uncharacterized membrane protein
MMDPSVPLIMLIAVFLTVGVPILAILAYIRLARLERAIGKTPQLTGRIYGVEQRLNAMEKRVASLAPNASQGTSEAHFPEISIPTASPPPKGSSAPLAPAEIVRTEQSRGTRSQVRPPTPQTPLTSLVPPAPPSHAAPLTRPSGPPRQAEAPATPVADEHAHSAPSPLGTATPAPSPIPPPPANSSPISLPPGSPKRGDDVETMIAGRWLNYVGILALALAVSFFLKYAFDNNWIGPAGRVTLGLLVGSALYPLGESLFHKGYDFYSDGITALGAAILYLSVWAGWHYYQIFRQSYAFPMMIVITAATAIVAVMRNSERMAFLAAIGGLLTPILVSTGKNAETVLFGYLVILGAGMLGISWVKDWKSLPPFVFIVTLIYFWSWYAVFYAEKEREETVAFATLFFVLFAALPAVGSLRRGEMTAPEIGMVLSNATQYLVALRLMLWPEYNWGLTFLLVALAGAHWAAERAVPRNGTRASQTARTIYGGLALAFLTLTIPVRFEGKWITIAWAIEGAILVWSGLRIRSRTLRSAGLILFLLVGIRLVAHPIQAEPVFLLNSRFLTIALSAASYLAAYVSAARSDTELEVGETQMYLALGGAANLLFLVGLSLEVWDFYGRMPSVGMDRSLSEQLALSVLWLMYASVLMGAGVKWKSAALRWQALVLLGVVILKVFFFDLSFLTRFYRILSFFFLGLVLLAVSFIYQRRTRSTS